MQINISIKVFTYDTEKEKYMTLLEEKHIFLYFQAK